MKTANRTTPYKVFIVDDSIVVIERLYRMLIELRNISVTGCADNVESALNLIKMQPPDAVILDIHLEADTHYRNGMHLLTLLRKTYPDMVIIMLTNLSGNQYRHKCMELGANYFFDKTNDFDKIPAIIQNLLSSNIS